VHVTGYVRLFSDEASATDQCDNIPFFNHWMVRKAIGGLDIRVIN
jgi:hypothetical protein